MVRVWVSSSVCSNISISVVHLLDTSIWSIWLASLVPGIFQVSLWISFLGYHVLKTLKLLVLEYWTNLRPLLFVISCKLCLPVMSLYRVSQNLCHKLSLGIPHPQISKKSYYQHGSKSEQVPRYPVLCRNPRNASKTAELPFHIRFDSHVTAVASYTQVFIVHAWVVPRWLFFDRVGDRKIEHADSS